MMEPCDLINLTLVNKRVSTNRNILNIMMYCNLYITYGLMSVFFKAPEYNFVILTKFNFDQINENEPFIICIG